jgi:hypothetical protein
MLDVMVRASANQRRFLDESEKAANTRGGVLR